MPAWDNERTVQRMADILHPERKKKPEGPFGALMEAFVPHSPRGDDKNASKKSKRGLQVRRERKGLSKKGKGRASV